MPAISDQDMNAALREESRIYRNEFNNSAALYELCQYTVLYQAEVRVVNNLIVRQGEISCEVGIKCEVKFIFHLVYIQLTSTLEDLIISWN